MASCVAGTTGMYHHTSLLIEMKSTHFCLGWPQTVMVQISNSQVAEITGMSHCTQRLLLFLYCIPEIGFVFFYLQHILIYEFDLYLLYI
jgi:hypothetical protein